MCDRRTDSRMNPLIEMRRRICHSLILVQILPQMVLGSVVVGGGEHHSQGQT